MSHLKNISDIIENYLKEILDLSAAQHIDVRRNELAERFQCVPSQVNYVINTRFTLDKGFLIESKRGGGGYIRIVKVLFHDQADLLDQVVALIGEQISASRAEDLLIRLFEERIITERELKMMVNVVNRATLEIIELPYRDQLRARLLVAMIKTLRYQSELS